MEQSAVTLSELGIAPLMTSGTAARQRQMGEFGKREDVRAAKTASVADLLDALNKAAGA
jgi:hypothetical protein